MKVLLNKEFWRIIVHAIHLIFSMIFFLVGAIAFLFHDYDKASANMIISFYLMYTLPKKGVDY